MIQTIINLRNPHEKVKQSELLKINYNESIYGYGSDKEKIEEARRSFWSKYQSACIPPKSEPDEEDGISPTIKNGIATIFGLSFPYTLAEGKSLFKRLGENQLYELRKESNPHLPKIKNILLLHSIERPELKAERAQAYRLLFQILAKENDWVGLMEAFEQITNTYAAPSSWDSIAEAFPGLSDQIPLKEAILASIEESLKNNHSKKASLLTLLHGMLFSNSEEISAEFEKARSIDPSNQWIDAALAWQNKKSGRLSAAVSAELKSFTLLFANDGNRMEAFKVADRIGALFKLLEDRFPASAAAAAAAAAASPPAAAELTSSSSSASPLVYTKTTLK
jgi:hypothetical protein